MTRTMLSLQSLPLLVLSALALFQLKHFACDFALQTPRQIRAKGNYGQLAGLEHAGLHAIASLPALLVLTQSAALIVIAIVGEFLVHYHVDFSKARIDKWAGFSSQSTAYWIVFGFDQLVHQATYLALVFLLMPKA
jgi:hypothetical protein